MPDLIGVLREARHGDSRLLLLLALERSRAPEVPAMLDELRDDPALAKASVTSSDG